MAKFTYTTLAGANWTAILTALNNNFEAVQNAFDLALFRDGELPNHMLSTLDMNSNRVVNLPQAISSTEPVRKLEFDALVELVEDGGDGGDSDELNPPIVILATGQSNLVDFQTFAWAPPSNLRVWNWSYLDPETPGTAFEDPASSTVSFAEAFAAEYAHKHPNQIVNLIIAAYPDQAITHWLPGAVAFDMYDIIQDNVPPALIEAGASEIDVLLWNQGASDLNDRAAYPGRFEDVVERFVLEDWWKLSTPIIICGLAPTSISSAAQSDLMNIVLMSDVAGADPNHRKFFNTGLLTDASYWRDTQHMTGVGYHTAGMLCYHNYAHDYGRCNIGKVYTGPVDLDNIIIPGDFTVSGGFVVGGASLFAAVPRMSNNVFLTGRNAANSADIVLAGANSGDQAVFGDTGFVSALQGLVVVVTDGTQTLTLGAGAVAIANGNTTFSSHPFGYAAGAGGTVTQATNKATAVTLDKPSGQITMNAANLAADTTVSFTLNNAFITAGDVLILNHVSGGSIGSYNITASCTAGSATIYVRNVTPGALAEAIVIGYGLVFGATT